MALNLSRNTRLFITDVAELISGNTILSGFDSTKLLNTNTVEIPILDGYSFSQNTQTQDITLNEAGPTPVRGQKVFNSALDPVDFSISTYIRPDVKNSKDNAIEMPLWLAMAAGDGTAGDTFANVLTSTDVTNTTTYLAENSGATVAFGNSNKHQLKKFALLFLVDNSVYVVGNAQIISAEVDFSIDGIAMINWTGQGTYLQNITDIVSPSVLSSANDGTSYTGYNINAPFIANKLTNLTVIEPKLSYHVIEIAGIDGAGTSGTIDFYTKDMTISGATKSSVIQVVVAGTSNADATASAINAATGLVAEFSGTTVYVRPDSPGVALSVDSDTYTNLGTSVTLGQFGTSQAFTYTATTGSTLDAEARTTTTTYSPDTAGDTFTEGKRYNLPITGGSLTIDNGVTFLTPEELGVINRPFTSFTGTRAINGTLTAYLRTGDGSQTAALLKDMSSDHGLSIVTHTFDVTVDVGAAGSGEHVAFNMPYCHLSIPSVNVEDVVSVSIEFSALGSELETTDELSVTYYNVA
jgi:hypothetical protein